MRMLTRRRPHKTMRSGGLIVLGLTMISIAGCSSGSTARTAPDYSVKFLTCVDRSYADHVWRPCISEVLKDWLVLTE